MPVPKKGNWLDENFPHGASKENLRNSKVKIPNENLTGKRL